MEVFESTSQMSRYPIGGGRRPCTLVQGGIGIGAVGMGVADLDVADRFETVEGTAPHP